MNLFMVIAPLLPLLQYVQGHSRESIRKTTPAIPRLKPYLESTQ
jgi:hypothetical protein